MPNCYNNCKRCSKRYHATWFWCQVRRYHEGKLDKSKYVFYPETNTVIAKNSTVYLLAIDNERKYLVLKSRLLKWWLTIAEFLAS